MTKAKAVIIALALLCLTGFRNQGIIGGLHPDFSYAMLKMPNGQVCYGKLERWSYQDENSGRVELKVDGIDYVTHYSNVCLFSEKPDWLEVKE